MVACNMAAFQLPTPSYRVRLSSCYIGQWPALTNALLPTIHQDVKESHSTWFGAKYKTSVTPFERKSDSQSRFIAPVTYNIAGELHIPRLKYVWGRCHKNEVINIRQTDNFCQSCKNSNCRNLKWVSWEPRPWNRACCIDPISSCYLLRGIVSATRRKSTLHLMTLMF